MAPTCFISYSWETQEHKDWVRILAETLQMNGVVVHLDQWDIYPGADLTQYMETCIKDSEYILLVCSPSFAQKANARKGGVGYEQAVVTGEIFEGVASPRKFVPILRKGNQEQSLPSYLKSRVYIDFRNDDDFDPSFESLLRHLHTSPKYLRPPLGPEPVFRTTYSGASDRTADLIDPRSTNQQRLNQESNTPLDLEKLKLRIQKVKLLKDLVQDALDLTDDQAKKWADTHMDQFENIDLDIFENEYRKFYEFGYWSTPSYGRVGLGMSSDKASAWAFNQLMQSPSINFESFEGQFTNIYLIAHYDLKMNEDEAIQWSLDHMKELAGKDLPAFAARFTELCEFAESYEGLNMDYYEAIDWARENALKECLSLPCYQLKGSDDPNTPGTLKNLLNRFRTKPRAKS